MTEEDWMAATDPTPMLEFLRGKASDRKLRLFACACCRRCLHLLNDDYFRQVEHAEQFADGVGPLTKSEALCSNPFLNGYIMRCLDRASTGAIESAVAAVGEVTNSDPYSAAMEVCWLVQLTYNADRERTTSEYSAEGSGRQVQVALLRDIFGNPFRPVALNPSWLTSTVVALANGIYNDKAFDQMPILADAPQDAGCDNEEVLNHCRQPGKHVRGCSVVDLLLDKQYF